ncbi:MAG: hypothetical protein IID33_08905 [Planctomycetes bacterium]|nr:hypothetical protein [Planctomycetota bacterium]
MKSRIPCISLALASSLFAAGSAFAQTPTLSLQAVRINDVAITPSNSITVKPGDTIMAEIFVSDWSPDGERLVAYQTVLSFDALVSGTSGSVLPLGWDRPLTGADDIGCITDNDCPAEFPSCDAGGFFCVGPNHDPAQGVFIDPNRGDWVFFSSSSGSPFPGLAVVDFAGPVIRYAALLINPGDAQTYALPPKYCATLRLEVSNDASGTFGFEIDPPDSVLFDDRIIRILPLALIGLTIEIDPCGNGVIDAGEACDGADLGDCPGSCADDCTCLPVELPTVSTWGLAALTLSLLAAGRVYFGRRSSYRLVS